MSAVQQLLFVNQQQFGYLTDLYRWCQYLRGRFAITVVCWDYGLRRVPMEGVRIQYVSRSGPKIVRLARFIAAVVRELGASTFSVCFVVYFRGCSLVRLLAPTRTVAVDVRTASVRMAPLRRSVEDLLLRLECRLYPRISIISESLRVRLGLPQTRCRILPVGGEMLALSPKKFDRLRLLYVGTLYDRTIDLTIAGFDALMAREGINADALVERYDIVGDGPPADLERLRVAIAASPNGDKIYFHGRVPNAQLETYFARANVGVAFIPVTERYQAQPSSKVFEYFLAGMPVIATETLENARVITGENGILIPDTALGFADGLERLVRHAAHYDSQQIRDRARPYRWPEIVDQILDPYLRELIDRESPGAAGHGDAVVATLAKN